MVEFISYSVIAHGDILPPIIITQITRAETLGPRISTTLCVELHRTHDPLLPRPNQSKVGAGAVKVIVSGWNRR